MASYHCTVKIGGKGKAASHSAYISREGKYSRSNRYEDLESTAYGNMPSWAEHNPAHFWNAADEYERANGATYREIEVALPRELNPKQRRALVEDFIAHEIGNKHAYQWAIHTPKAALEKGVEQAVTLLANSSFVLISAYMGSIAKIDDRGDHYAYCGGNIIFVFPQCIPRVFLRMGKSSDLVEAR